jgi:hypothetical protein
MQYDYKLVYYTFVFINTPLAVTAVATPLETARTVHVTTQSSQVQFS